MNACSQLRVPATLSGYDRMELCLSGCDQPQVHMDIYPSQDSPAPIKQQVRLITVSALREERRDGVIEDVFMSG